MERATTSSNEELSQIVETSDEWIKSRTGIGKRHLADRSVSLSQLAALVQEKISQPAERLGSKSEFNPSIAVLEADKIPHASALGREGGPMDGP